MNFRRAAQLVVLFAIVAPTPKLLAGCLPDSIPDGGYIGIGDLGDGTGADAGMLCCPIDVTELVPGVVSDVNVTLMVTHTYVGDLVIKLKSPTSTISTLQSRAGFDEPFDDGGFDAGAAADWDGAAIRYDEQSLGPSAELMGQSLADTGKVCTDNGVCAHTPAAGSGPGAGLDTDFDGETYVGLWELCIGDAAMPDAGTWNDFLIEIRVDRTIACACDGKFRGGDRVIYAPFAAPDSDANDRNRARATPEGPALLPGALGEAMCGDSTPASLLVAWDGFTGGHDGNGFCECPQGNLAAGSTNGWWVDCAELLPDLPFFDDFETGDANHWSFASD